MRYSRTTVLVILVASALIVSGCTLGQQPEPTPDVGLIYTQAAQTVSAQFALQQTQTALAAPSPTLPPPTATSFPTIVLPGSPVAPGTTLLSPLGTPLGTLGAPLVSPTPLGALATSAGTSCNNSAFITDVNFPDGTAIKVSKYFEKVWRIQNTGTCTWDDGYALVHVAGSNLSGGNWVIKYKSQFVEPGATVDIAILMVSPSTAGEAGGCWRMRGDDGYYFGTFVCIEIYAEE